MAITKFQDLNLKNSFLFAAFMRDPENAKLVLELLLNREIGNVEVHTEHSILYNSDFKSVRLDVFMSEDSSVDFDLEMQKYGAKNLPKRSRFYQSQIDVASLKPGEDYNALKPVFVIFICTFDPFGEGLYRYTFENQCLESGFPLGDGAQRIFVNTKGMNADEVPNCLVELLNYIEDSTDSSADDASDARIRTLHENVGKLKRDRTWEGCYMTMEEYIRDEVEERVEREVEERVEREVEERVEREVEERVERARAEYSCLVKVMRQHGESAETIADMAENPEFFDEMARKYQAELKQLAEGK